MRKILYSPDFGAGWTSWEGDYEVQKFMVSYSPIIEFLEDGGTFEKCDLDIWTTTKLGIDPQKLNKLPDCLKQFVKECLEKFEKVPYLAGLRDIQVKVVSGPVKIDDYDGNESVIEGGGEWL